MTDTPRNDAFFNEAISKSKRLVKDFMTLEHFSITTGLSKANIKWIIKKRDSNGADFFLYQIGHKQKWMLSPSRFKEWKEKRGSKRTIIKNGETK